MAYGIDLGTTNSTLCRAELPIGSTECADPEVIELRQPTLAGEHIGTLLPSMVALHEGREFVGQGAKDLRAMMADPSRAIVRNRTLFFECKNEIGTSRTYPNAPENYRSPTEIAARVLAYVRREGMGGDATGNVVVTVPASFQAAQRAETARACALAGIDSGGGRLLDEPVAAFIDYAYRYAPGLLDGMRGEQRLLVFDFGGGTCDIAIFDLTRPSEGSALKVASRSASRYHRLGGGDIDLAILHGVLIPQACRENGLDEYALSFRDKTAVVMPALIAVAEALKVQLCNDIWRLQQFGRFESADKTAIVARYPAQVSMQVEGGRRTLRLSAATLDAIEFERVLAPFLDRDHLFARTTEYRLECSMFSPVADALERGGIEPGGIDYVLPVGGSSLIPQVVSALRAYFPRARILEYEDRKDPQIAIARGASLHALTLAATGKGIVEPVAQDDIFLTTQQRGLLLVRKGTALPFPGQGVAVNEELVVPRDAVESDIRLSVELTAGAERRLLYRDHWNLSVVRKGDPIRLEYAYDENQVLALALRQARFPESVAFEARIENPLSHVVNPNRTQEEIDRLEEEYRIDPRLASEVIPKIAELCSELGQNEKAIGLVRELLRRENRPVAWLLNRQAMYEDARGNKSAAVKSYEEAGRASHAWGGPLFNLALFHDRQGENVLALKVIDRALAREDRPPYRTLKLRVRKRINPDLDVTREAQTLLTGFGSVGELDDWAMGWYLAAADLAQDKDARQVAERERTRRRTGVAASREDGELPAVRGPGA